MRLSIWKWTQFAPNHPTITIKTDELHRITERLKITAKVQTTKPNMSLSPSPLSLSLCVRGAKSALSNLYLRVANANTKKRTRR